MENINKWWFAASILLFLYALASISTYFLQDTSFIANDRIVVIPVSGTIMMDANQGGLIDFQTAAADDLIEKINEARDNPSVKAVLFEINSPGGSAVASKEVADAIKQLNKTNYAVIREVGASGAYWIAAATDKVFAQEASITGSVGVISSYLEFSGLFDKYGITYERLTAGQYKDLGTPYKELTPDERAILQNKLDIIHKQFLHAVQTERNLTSAHVTRIQTGEFFLGSEALQLGLIDTIGNKQDALTALKQAINQEDIAVVEEKPSEGILSYFTKTGAYYFGKGFGASLSRTDIQHPFSL